MLQTRCRECGSSAERASPGGPCPKCDTRPAVRFAGAEERAEDGIVAALALARRQLDMDVALLGEVADGREVVRCADGDTASFGVVEGAGLDLSESYCQHVLEGRISGAVPDASANEAVADMRVTRSAGIGAYVGVPISASDARLYMLCCLAHESRPGLGDADLRFMRGLGETVLAALERRHG